MKLSLDADIASLLHLFLTLREHFIAQNTQNVQIIHITQNLF